MPVLAFLAAAAVGCSNVAAGQQAVEVDSWGDPTVSGCAAEESQVGTWTVDLYKYPARQISWDASDDPNVQPERGPYDVLSKDQTYMKVPVSIQFDMTNDCELLKQFHRDYGTKYQGWLNDDGTTSDGWKNLLANVISQPTEIALTAISRNYNYEQIWNEEKIRVEYQKLLLGELPKESARRTGGVEYFSNFRVDVLKPYPADERIRNAKSNEISAAAEANTKKITAEADANARKAAAVAGEQAALAEAAQERAEAEKKKAEIAGFGTGPEAVEAWNKATCIEKAPACTPYPAPVFNN